MATTAKMLERPVADEEAPVGKPANETRTIAGRRAAERVEEEQGALSQLPGPTNPRSITCGAAALFDQGRHSICHLMCPAAGTDRQIPSS